MPISGLGVPVLSKSGIHLIRAVACLARLREEQFVGAGELARSIDAPGNYLGKLLQTLARLGLVESRKGVGGGFRLARDPASLSLLEVVDPVEQISRWTGCILGNRDCSDEQPCAVHDQWGDLRRRYMKLLSETTIQDILADPNFEILQRRDP